MKKLIYIIIFVAIPTLSIAQISDKLTIAKQDIRTEKVNGYDKIYWKSDIQTQEVGSPELPFYSMSYVLPVNAQIIGVTFTTKAKQKHEQKFNILPVQQPVLADISTDSVFTQSNSPIYQSNSPYPNKLYEIESDGFYMGYHLVTLRLYPFEYLPLTQTLNYYSQLEFTINYTSDINNNKIYPQTQSLYRAEQCKERIKHLVKNTDDVDRFGANAQTIRDGKKIIQNLKATVKGLTLQKTKSLSVFDDQVPDYIIITNNALKPSFQTLADWKTQKGVFTIIKTTEEIATNYQGSDLQEKIRNYLIDIYGKYGAGLYILLGGDINIVPSRMVSSVDDSSVLIPTDTYYSAYYSFSWTVNGGVLSPPPGSLKNNLNVILGRVPLSNTQEVSTYISKLILYEKTNGVSDLSYYKNILISDAFMLRCSDLNYRSDNGKSGLKSYIDTYLPSEIKERTWCLFDDSDCNGTLYNYGGGNACCYDSYYGVPCPGGSGTKGNEEFSRNSFLTAMNTGANSGYGKFHIIYHMDHSSSQGIGTSSKDKGEGISKVDMGSLYNGNSYQIFMSGGCHPANFAENCVAQYYLANSTGGGVAFIGNTDSGYTFEYTQFQYFIDAIYNTTGHPDIGRYDIGSAFQNIFEANGSIYTTNCRLHLLGDPEMQVWTAEPTTLTPTLSSTALSIGEQTVNVTVAGLPTGTKGRICFWKGTEVYVTQEDVTNGTYPISFTANTPGNILVTVMAHNFKPSESIITVNSTNNNPNLLVSTVDFGDGIVQGLGNGNGNGQNDAGETINLTLGIKNTGVNTANNVTATLSCSSPYITITSSQGSFGNITSGTTVTSNQFNYTIDKNAKEVLSNVKAPVQFIVTMTDVNNTSWTHKYNIDVFNDMLVQCNKKIVSTTDDDLIPEAGETVTMNIALQNLGKAPTKGLTAILTSTNGNCTINSGDATYNTIAPLEIINGNAIFSFNTNTSSLDQMAFNLQVTNAYGKIWNFPFNLVDPPQISNILFTSDPSYINLTWNVLTNIAGYNIYRCNVDQSSDAETSTYISLNKTPVSFSYFNDTKDLQPLTKYSYKIVAVSTTGKEGASTKKIAYTSFPYQPLFPKTIDGSAGWVDSPVNVADVNFDSKKELFLGTNSTNSGRLIELDYQGNEMFNIDNNVTTLSGFSILSSRGTAIPAIADTRRDGNQKLIEPTRGSNNNIYCFTFENDPTKLSYPKLDWSYSTTNTGYRGAVVANIDNSADGSLETVSCSEDGVIRIYNNTGNLINTKVSSAVYGAIAIADLDGDGDKEIIKGCDDGVYVWHHDFSDYSVGHQPLFYSPSDYRLRSSVIVCDIDNNGKKDILCSALKQQADRNTPSEGKIYAIRTDIPNSLVANWVTPTISYDNDWHSQEITVGDINNDNKLEVVALGIGIVKIWNNAGSLLKSIDVPGLCPGRTAPSLADVDGNGTKEIIFGSGTYTNSKVYAFKFDGNIVTGFPITLDKESTSVSVADIDNDGKNELIMGSSTKIYAWKTNGLPSAIEWGSERHDQYNTGEYQTICDPTLITSNATWNANQSICGDLIVKSGTLTINSGSNITLGSSSMIIVMSGASLVIDSGHILNANIRAMAGSNVTIRNNGSITLRSNAEFYTEKGTIVDLPYGSIDK